MRKKKDPQDEAWEKVTKEWELDTLDKISFDYGWTLAINYMIKKFGRPCRAVRRKPRT